MQQAALNFDGPTLSPDQKRVWAVISRRRGRAMAIPMPRLAEYVFLDPAATRRVQTLVHDLIQAGFPIGSASSKPNGYFVITTVEEYVAARKNIMNRIRNMSRRVKALKRHCPELAGQLILNTKAQSHERNANG